MPGQRKLDNENEKAAIRFKQKEQRSLAKSFQTLDLEKNYSLKLLNLDHRIVRVNYKHLKDKVSRIRSNLSAEEITHLKKLENSGRLKTYSNTVNLSSALKIAAAAKRLKLQNPNTRAATAMPMLTRSSPMDTKTPTPRSDTAPTNTLRRSNSVTGVFIDAPGSNVTQRRNSVDAAAINRPLTAVPTKTLDEEQKKVSKRPMTSHNTMRVPPTPRSPIHPMPAHSPYSSHTTVEKDTRAQSGRDTRMLFSDDSIDSNLGEDLYEERRQEFLLTEEIRREELDDRRGDFLERLNKYLAENPTRDWSEVQTTFTLPDSTESRVEDDEEAEKDTSLKPKRKLLPGRSRLNMATSLTNEHLYKQKMVEMWKDLNKCRYLRLPDERIDLSGVETLARNQIKLYEMLQAKESVKS